MIYVYRNGQLVPKQARAVREIDFPMIGRFDAYASPIDDAWISSSRMRERDMARNDAYDPRDMPAGHFREKEHGRAAPEWKSPGDPGDYPD
jgi:hypothetical protein